MPRSRVVRPITTRVELWEQYVRTLERLRTKGWQIDIDKFRPATVAELAAVTAALDAAKADGAWIEVRHRLTAGEQRAMFARMAQKGDGPVRVDPFTSGPAQVAAYLLDWNLPDDDGNVIPIRRLGYDDLVAVLDGLPPDDFSEIKTAIEDHVEQVDAALEEEKKTRAGDRGSIATLQSVG